MKLPKPGGGGKDGGLGGLFGTITRTITSLGTGTSKGPKPKGGKDPRTVRADMQRTLPGAIAKFQLDKQSFCSTKSRATMFMSSCMECVQNSN